MNLQEIEEEIIKELGKATARFKSFPTMHHGYAVIKEELEELWEEIKRKPRNHEAIEKEAIQTATMAIRFLIDLTDE